VSGPRPIRIAPSLLSADFASLARDLARAEEAGADLHHVDVMDGHFVPNLTIGPPVVRSVRRATSVPLDVHVMITRPLAFAEAFVKAGADGYTFHVEAEDDPVETARAVRALGAKAGITLNPDTPIESLRPLLPHVDRVLVMSVFPGFAGQSFLPESLDRVRAVRAMGWDGELEIDGGIGPSTIADAAAAGADLFVAGSAVYGADEGVELAIPRLRRLAEEGRDRAG
jgi:ribulose-phosphate 3-epimerase